MSVSLKTPLKNLTKVGLVTSKRLETLGLKTVSDLLFYYPARYDDYSRKVAIKDARPEEWVTIRAKVVSITNLLTPYKHQKITQATVADGSGAFKVVWFNQPYLAAQIKVNDCLSLSGKIEYTGFGLEMRSPE